MLLALRMWNRWLTIETGQVGDENEPEVEKVTDSEEEKKEDESDKKITTAVTKHVLGFSLMDPYEVAVEDE